MRSPTDIALDRHLSPVNQTAARVVSKGIGWVPDKNITTIDSQNPIAYGPISPKSEVVAGKRFGSLRVLGRAVEQGTDKSKKSKGTAYVCRCDCGYYTVRRSKAVMNPVNTKDACGRCIQKQYLSKLDYYRTHGKNREGE